MKPLRAALYARVSTRDKGQDTENQLIQLREYCARQGWTIVHEYVDHISGKRSDNRSQFQALFTAASRREFDVVVVWALDRFSREGVMQTFEHIKTLKSFGVDFESFTEAHFRTTGRAGDLMIAVAAWIAEQERTRISERVQAGLARAKAQGRILGRPPANVRLARVQELRARGFSLREIADKTGVSTMTAQRLLKRSGAVA
jgi:DNA invertase Pin-like site-specific DNA recombinase